VSGAKHAWAHQFRAFMFECFHKSGHQFNSLWKFTQEDFLSGCYWLSWFYWCNLSEGGSVDQTRIDLFDNTSACVAWYIQDSQSWPSRQSTEICSWIFKTTPAPNLHHRMSQADNFPKEGHHFKLANLTFRVWFFWVCNSRAFPTDKWNSRIINGLFRAYPEAIHETYSITINYEQKVMTIVILTDDSQIRSRYTIESVF
jgi:hypothetical protein